MRAPGLWLGMGASKMNALPAVGKISPISILMVVVLPAPFGPTKPKISPSSTVEVEVLHRVHLRRREPDLEGLGEPFRSQDGHRGAIIGANRGVSNTHPRAEIGLRRTHAGPTENVSARD